MDAAAVELLLILSTDFETWKKIAELQRPGTLRRDSAVDYMMLFAKSVPDWLDVFCLSGSGGTNEKNALLMLNKLCKRKDWKKILKNSDPEERLWKFANWKLSDAS